MRVVKRSILCKNSPAHMYIILRRGCSRVESISIIFFKYRLFCGFYIIAHTIFMFVVVYMNRQAIENCITAAVLIVHHSRITEVR